MREFFDRHPWLWFVAGFAAVRAWEALDAGECLPGGVGAAFRPANLTKSVEQLIGCGSGK